MEISSLLKNFLDKDGKLKAFPAKRKMKLYALYYLSGKFEPDRIYTEKEVNELLGCWHTFGDSATLRRELYDCRFIGREKNGASYWLEKAQPDLETVEKKYG